MALLLGRAASAQDVQQADLARCAGLATAEARLACFEALTRSGQDDAARPTDIRPAPAESSVPAESVTADEATSAAAGSGAATTADAEPGSDAEPASAQVQGIPEHVGKPADVETVNETIVATVVNVESGRNKVLYFHFENGQVWRQIEGRRFGYPKNQAFDVEITTGMMGEYRLRLATGGSMTRIRRVR